MKQQIPAGLCFMHTSPGHFFYPLSEFMAKFEKPAKSDDLLVAQLIERKLLIEQPEKVKTYLSHIGYYRLSGYMHPFLKRDGTKEFQEGSHFSKVLDSYLFDKKLRQVLLDMCERIEISIKTNLCNIMALKHGPHWYLDGSHFRKYDHYQHFIHDVEEYCTECHDSFIKHYLRKYSAPRLPPIWMIIQTLTFGQVSRLYDNLKASPERSAIAYCYGITPGIFESWLKSISFVRNCCAHHSRVWNRHFPLKPIIPTDKDKCFLATVNDDTNKRLYGTLSCMLAMLEKINPNASCRRRLKGLFREYPHVSLVEMGFTADWENSSIWKD